MIVIMNGPILNKSMDMLFPVQDLSDKMMIKPGRRYCLIELEHVLLLKGEGNYTRIIIRDDEYAVLMSKLLNTALKHFIYDFFFVSVGIMCLIVLFAAKNCCS